MAAIQPKRPSSTLASGRPSGRRISAHQSSTLARMAQAAGPQVPGLPVDGQQSCQFALPFPGICSAQPAGRLSAALRPRRRRVGPRPLTVQAPGNDWSDALLAAYAPPTFVLSDELEVHATVGAGTADYLRRPHWHCRERIDLVLAPDLLPHFIRLCRAGETNGSLLVTRADGRRLRMCLRMQPRNASNPGDANNAGNANSREQRFSYLSFEPDCATPAAESSLAELNDNLLARNDELARAVSLLQSSQKAARLALQAQRTLSVQAVDQLAGGVAHEFNNILASIMGYTDLLSRALHDSARKAGRGAAEPANSQRYVAEIMRASERARGLVQQLLLCGRSSDGSRAGGSSTGSSIQSRPSNPVHLLDEIARQLSAALPAAIDFSVARGEHLPRTSLDAAHITQALTNIVVNAREAIQSRQHAPHAQESCAGRIELTADVATLSAQPCASCHRTFAGTYLQLSVRDSGPGVTEAMLPRLFEPFFTSKDIGKGPGLGLSATHGIMHAHGGHITVHSSGNGAAFTLHLPVAPD